MKLYIKNMVSDRCKMIVKSELEKLELQYVILKFGELEILDSVSAHQQNLLNASLKKSGLEIIDDKKSMLIEKIKNIIIEMVHYSENPLKIKFSEYLSEKLNYDYTYLSNLFSEKQGSTIEYFILSHKIERVKELLIYNELNITEIANLMHYSSVAHLSNQFKKMAGLTPTHYKHLRLKIRKPLENL